MKISELKIGDMFEVYSSLAGRVLARCVFVGVKPMTASKAKSSKSCFCFISYGLHNQSFYSNLDVDIKLTNFKYKKCKFDVCDAISIFSNIN